jgi:hypothetical protein
MAGGGNAVTLPVDGTYVKVASHAQGTTITVDLSTSAEDEIDATNGLGAYFFTDAGSAVGTESLEAKGTGFFTISGCTANPAFNKEFYYSALAYSSTILTFTLPGFADAGAATSSSSAVAANSHVVFGSDVSAIFPVGTKVTVLENSGTAYTIGGSNPGVGDEFYVVELNAGGTEVGLSTSQGGALAAATNGAATTFKISATTANLPWAGVTSACVGDTITISSRTGTLKDSKAIAVGDRVKALVTDSSQATHQLYETRTVDKVWGSNLDVTMFSVKDPFVNTRTLQDVVMWVDESGSTEDVECSRRGLCDGETGTCQCFAGYTGGNCNSINSLSQ